MKKIYKILLGIIVFFFILLISTPLLFQDKVMNLVKTTINNNVNAKVDFSDSSLSLLRNFPNASVQLSNLTVINNTPFEGDTLVYAKEVNLALKLTELFKASSEQLNIKSFTIDDALVNVLVDKKGNANYDIAKPSETEETKNEEPSTFGLSINSYAINNATIKYNDEQGKLNLELAELNHSGSGDFSQSNTELDTQTSTLVSFGMDGNSYAKNQKIELDAILGMDLTNMKFSFLKNEAKLNNLPLVFDGFVQVNEKNQEVDINFKTPSSDFKNFLGLIPEAYTKSIAGVSTTGNFSVNGKVNGIIDDKHIPKLDISMKSNNASFKYPDLPKSVQNINIDAQIKNTTGKTENTFVTINGLSFKIDQDTFSGKGNIYNLTTNPKINASLKGVLNLANINKAYPIDLENDLSGILKADLHTEFDMKAIENNTLSRIKNNGKMEVSDFIFSSKDVVNPLHIKNTVVNFTPGTITLSKFDATSGKSDLNATGTIKNLLGFLLSDKKLQGNFKLNSNNFYVSDFMQESPEAIEKKEETSKKDTPKESLKIPAFLDCAVSANAQTVYYDNLTLKNVRGTLLLKDEKAILQNMNAGIFNGQIALNGEVNTQQKKPTFDMKLGIKSFDISQSFTSLDLLQSLSPIAGAMNGKLNSDIDLMGSLNDDFTPNLTSISGNALAELLTTSINPEKTKALSLLNNKLSFIDLKKLDLSDIKTYLSFKEGNVIVKPFDLKYKDIGITVGGNHGFDKTMNYNVTLNVPAKYLGNEAQGLLAKLSAKEQQNITVPITANITGNMTSPSVKTDLSSSVTKLSQKLVQQQKDKLVNNAIGSLLGNKKKDSTNTTNKKDETVKKVTDVLGGLFGKKKKKQKDTVK
ncbi:AsmA-like C-terminal region [Tenacibaculum mesophilum]|uniref:AsmA family protein n=1 Tax=Tenacibaculum mesophilum TaxID=104268 RepID=A0AAE9SHJ4_9FLAO|nr:AsmA-like C-terminal region-containing protein [Tenacibaculum mesophilum]AZJ33179.1 AsmA family protein [Tenacibaculum mesophilum]QFS28427.1 AsmA family protein [Tenacibaculum mesophilum]UTD15884.1 AsmA family protein [Tenacibaculum mesophilum]SHF65927.1 AsmA-like C-terminal region [Tenacibaculum mesophilum]